MGPKCPNHRVPLVDCHNGIGICPISSARFTYQGDEDEKEKKLKINSFGQAVLDHDWKVKQIGGNGG